MVQTTLNTQQFSGVQRDDLDTTTTTKAVIAKAVQGSGITISSSGVDSGTGDVTINLDINGLTSDTAPEGDDYVATYDVSGTANKKVLVSDLVNVYNDVLFANHNTTQSASSSLTNINLNTNVILLGNGIDHDTSTDNDRIYVLLPDSSVYYITYQFNWSGGSAVVITGDVRYNNSTIIGGSAISHGLSTAGSTNTVHHSFFAQLDQGYYISLRLAASTNSGTWSNVYVSVIPVHIG